MEEPKVTRVEVEETQEEERKVTPEVEPEISVQMEESSESTPFKVAQPALKDVKVVGTIDLDAINQRTRPPKKVNRNGNGIAVNRKKPTSLSYRPLKPNSR